MALCMIPSLNENAVARGEQARRGENCRGNSGGYSGGHIVGYSGSTFLRPCEEVWRMIAEGEPVGGH